MKTCIECGKPLFEETKDLDVYLCDECSEIINGTDGYDEINQAELIQNSND